MQNSTSEKMRTKRKRKDRLGKGEGGEKVGVDPTVETKKELEAMEWVPSERKKTARRRRGGAGNIQRVGRPGEMDAGTR